MSNANRYEVVPSRRWIHTSGATASVYGACPWTSEADRSNWQTQDVGFTVYNRVSGTYGIGRMPWPTREAAQMWADSENARLAEIAARYAKG